MSTNRELMELHGSPTSLWTMRLCCGQIEPYDEAKLIKLLRRHPAASYTVWDGDVRRDAVNLISTEEHHARLIADGHRIRTNRKPQNGVLKLEKK